MEEIGTLAHELRSGKAPRYNLRDLIFNATRFVREETLHLRTRAIRHGVATLCQFNQQMSEVNVLGLLLFCSQGLNVVFFISHVQSVER